MNLYIRNLSALLFVGLVLVACNKKKEVIEPHATENKPISKAESDNPWARYRWVFERDPDYSPISAAYKGPDFLLNNIDVFLLPSEMTAEQSEMSADGHYVFFVSPQRLTANAPLKGAKLYRRSVPQDQGMSYGPIELVSKRPSGMVITASCGSMSLAEEAADDDVSFPSVSRDGNKVAFVSTATNLTPQLKKDEATGACSLVNLPPGQPRVYLLNLENQTIELVSGLHPEDGSRIPPDYWVKHKPAISLNGKVVAFAAHNPMNDDLLPPWKPDSAYLDIFLYNSQTKKTGWVSFPDVPAAALPPIDDKDRGDNIQPQLDEDGDTVVWKSYAKLNSQDHTDDPESDEDIADIYWAKFSSGPLGPEVDKRDSLKLVSVDKGLAFSSGSKGSSNPSVTADGDYVMFQSLKAPELIADIRPNTPPPPMEMAPLLRVYLRRMSSSQTSLISVKQFEDKFGSKSYSEMTNVDVAMYPIISPNGRYATFTSNANDIYMTDKMQKFYDGEIVSGTNNSCAAMVITGKEHESRKTTYDSSSSTGWTKNLEMGGWREAESTNCLPALDPYTNKKNQTYLVSLNGLQVTDIKPLSTTPPLQMTRWLTDYKTDPIIKLKNGDELLVSRFEVVWQAFYGDKSSYSGIPDSVEKTVDADGKDEFIKVPGSVSRLVADNGTVIFYSAADNLFKPVNKDGVLTSDFEGNTYYTQVPSIDVGYYASEDDTNPYYPGHPISTSPFHLQVWSTFIYNSAINPVVKIDK